jgi:hypothetical protein
VLFELRLDFGRNVSSGLVHCHRSCRGVDS